MPQSNMLAPPDGQAAVLPPAGPGLGGPSGRVTPGLVWPGTGQAEGFGL